VIRVVVDPSVLVSAFIGNPDAGPGRLIDAWLDGQCAMIVSPLLLDELAEVLARPKFAKWADDGRGVAYVAAFAAQAERHSDPPLTEASVRDPNDDYLVALARQTKADAVVSVDRDLLDAPVTDIAIVDPATFVARLSRV
jgi:putative PIN family toxin of toxin-antitoxin system